MGEEYMRRMSIATASSDDGNPNVRFGEFEENRRRVSIAEYKKYQVSEARPLMGLSFLGELAESGMSETQMDVSPDILLNTDQFFLTKGAIDFKQIFDLDLPHVYSLLNSVGERIFFVTETLEAYASAYSPHRDIDFTVLRRLGGVLFVFEGTTKKAKVQCEGRTIGTITKSFIGMTYLVKNVTQIPVFKVSPASNSRNSYEVFALGFAEPVGLIKPKWMKNNDPKLQNTFGMSLPKKLSSDSKVLLLSTFLILYFYHIQPAIRGDSRKKFWQAFGFSAGVGLLIFIMLMIITFTILFSKKR